MHAEPYELEDDPAEMVEHLIADVMQGDRTDVTKDQLRDALTKLIDARVATALAKA